MHTYAHPGSYKVTESVTSAQSQTYSASKTEIIADRFSIVGPVRVLDTRSGLGTDRRGAVGSNGLVQLQVDGVDGLPATGVTSVLLNVTAMGSDAAGYLTAYADGAKAPAASDLDYFKGATISNMVAVPVGADGKVTLLNHGGSVQILADIAGYGQPGDNTSGRLFTPVRPTQIFTTVGWGKLNGGLTVVAVYPQYRPFAAEYALVRVTAFGGTAPSYLTADYCCTAVKQPAVSTVNFAAGQTISNLAIVPISGPGYLGVYNHAGATNISVDNLGYFTNDPNAGRFVTVAPTRLLDTRTTRTPLKPGEEVLRVKVAGVDGIPANATAVTFNLTATGATSAGYFTAYADKSARPGVSDVDFAARQTIANQSVVPVGADGYIDIYNHTGTVSLVVDLQGYYLGTS